MPRTLSPLLTLFFLALVWPAPSFAQEKKKDDKKATPKIVTVAPTGVVPGQTVKLTLRGLNLDRAKELRVAAEGVKVKLKDRSKSLPPDNQSPDVVGDTQVVAEVTVPKEHTAPQIEVTVVTPDGDSNTVAWRVERELPVVAEKEDNGGFASAQPLKVPQVVNGSVSAARDVDVFRVAGQAGQKVRVEVFARRPGSGLDGMLTVYDANARQVAFVDDANGSRDPALEVTWPADGVYYLCLIDAHDRGGAATHPYWLVVRPAE